MYLGAMGIVYGDIGTSPLYAFQVCFDGPHSVGISEANILGVLSLIVWSLILVISIKYLTIVMRADNDGEGGILALLAIVTSDSEKRSGKASKWLILTGLFGASLLYGDGMITPAISVLSAVEGLKIATPKVEPFITSIAIGILLALFLFQHRGTHRIGTIFGPIMLVWFLVLGTMGVWQIANRPSVMAAINPWHAADFFLSHGGPGFFILGSVFLVVTGGEALYADMGHFGKRPIRVVWFMLILPALVLNYFGQGSLLLDNPAFAENPFFHLASDAWKYPLVVLSTLATVVASQAVISGAFSLTLQAVQLGYLPRMEILHTSETEFGQIYIPVVNYFLMAATIGLVIGFETSSRLASAYGMAVSTTMAITTVLAFVAMRRLWNWPLPVACLVAALLLTVDLCFFAANLFKIFEGGWFPLLVGLLFVLIMTTWRRGRELFAAYLEDSKVPYDDLLKWLDADPPARIPGTVIHLSSSLDSVPQTLLLNLRHNRVMHEQIAVVTLVFEKTPFVNVGSRITIETLQKDFYLIQLRYGFMQQVNVPLALDAGAREVLNIDPSITTYVLGRSRFLATKRPGMAFWRERLFGFLSNNAERAADYFGIPSRQVLEIGAEIELN